MQRHVPGPHQSPSELIGYQPTLDRFFSAWRTIERTSFGQSHGHSEGRCFFHAHRTATALPRTPTLYVPHSAPKICLRCNRLVSE